MFFFCLFGFCFFLIRWKQGFSLHFSVLPFFFQEVGVLQDIRATVHPCAGWHKVGNTQSSFKLVPLYTMIRILWKASTIKPYLMSWSTTLQNNAVSSHSLLTNIRAVCCADGFMVSSSNLAREEGDHSSLARETLAGPCIDAAVFSRMYLCCGFEVNYM